MSWIFSRFGVPILHNGCTGLEQLVKTNRSLLLRGKVGELPQFDRGVIADVLA
jgi:hypothetical protein